MELKDFIKTAITDITEAVCELQSQLNNGAIVNPTLPNQNTMRTLKVGEDICPIENLTFDIAVTVTETSGTDSSANAGISILGAKIGAESSARTENVSRLSFSIPIVFPATHVKTPQEIYEGKRPQTPED